jgi:hypothetical protein
LRVAGDRPVHAHAGRIDGELQSRLVPAGVRIPVPAGLEEHHVPGSGPEVVDRAGDRFGVATMG